MAVAGLLASMVWSVLGGAQVAHADGTVTDCSNDIDLTVQMSSGGLVTFNCNGPAPIIITVTLSGGIVPNLNTTLDGSNNGNPVTLSGGHANRLFDVQAGAALTLTNITLMDGNAAGGNPANQGGAILNEGDLLVLDQVTIRNSQSSFAGGAIRDIGGTTIVKNSLLEEPVGLWRRHRQRRDAHAHQHHRAQQPGQRSQRRWAGRGRNGVYQR